MDMDINSKTISFSNKIVQLRNISEASSWKDEAGKPDLGAYGTALFFVLAPIVPAAQSNGGSLIISALGLWWLWSLSQWKPKFELQFQTNAGKVTAFSSKDSEFIDDILLRIHRAMAEPDSPISYHVDVDAKQIQENRVHIHNSTGVNVVGGNATNTTQTATVSGPSLSEVSELIALVQASDAQNRQDLQGLLEDVRNFMAGGGKTKEQAKSSWEQFVRGMGSVAGAGSSLWDLVSKVSRLFA